MSYFLNLADGSVNINTYRNPKATATTVEDLVECFEAKKNENLVASLDAWIEESGGNLDDDNLERVVEDRLGLELADYPELRDIQRGESF
jgi:hypothetical protein